MRLGAGQSRPSRARPSNRWSRRTFIHGPGARLRDVSSMAAVQSGRSHRALQPDGADHASRVRPRSSIRCLRPGRKAPAKSRCSPPNAGVDDVDGHCRSRHCRRIKTPAVEAPAPPLKVVGRHVSCKSISSKRASLRRTPAGGAARRCSRWSPPRFLARILTKFSGAHHAQPATASSAASRS